MFHFFAGNIQVKKGTPEDQAWICTLQDDRRIRNQQLLISKKKRAEHIYQALNGITIRGHTPHIYTIWHDDKGIGYIEIMSSFANETAYFCIGFDLDPAYHKYGIMAHALEIVLLSLASEHSNALFWADCFATNYACRKLLWKLGFHPGTLTFREKLAYLTKHFVLTGIDRWVMQLDGWSMQLEANGKQTCRE